MRLFSKDNDKTKSGDFEEEFNENIEQFGLFTAKMIYLKQVFKSLPIFINRSINGSISMFKNYLKIAYRNFSKNKFFSSINILGLSIGMAVCLVIIQYVVHEFSYDKF
ncbi:MAG: hypothetical protein GY863_13360, partial [bacterium]|nr:hypothetical protein [bacterium]